MARSELLRNRDLLRLLKLSGEVGDLPPIANFRRHHAMQGLCRLIGAQVAILSDAVGFAPGQEPAMTNPVEGGWFGNKERNIFLAYLGDNQAADPVLEAFINTPGRQFTRLRHQLLPDDYWYRTRHVNEYRKPAGVDDCIYCFRRSNQKGTGQGIGLHKPWGDKQGFTERDRLVVDLFFRYTADRLSPPDPLAEIRRKTEKLTPRLRQTSQLLLTGLSEKEIAGRLMISNHTLHGYVKQIYRHFGASSRAEFMAIHIVNGIDLT